MTYLYVDSSNYLSLGLLNENLSWSQYTQTENLKSSSKLHSMVYEMLQNESKSFQDVEGIFLAAGPGSYTGIRLAEGLAQVLEWQGFPIYSFYHFEVPYLMGEKEGIWCSQAFKGECFLYQWEGDKNQNKLIKKDELEANLEGSINKYSHYGGLLDGNFIYTSDLIRESEQEFFSKIKERGLHLDPFYFRSLEQEFQVPGRSI